jgi:cytochrome b561
VCEKVKVFDVALPRDQRFDGLSICFHWITLVLVVAQFSSAWLLSAATGEQAAALLRFHRSLGLVIWLVTAARFAWRRVFAHLPPFPANMPRLQQRLAKLNEYGLYMLLLFQPLTGLADALFLGRPFPLFLWQVPAILPRDKWLADLLFGVHYIGGYELLGLIGMHAFAALFHRFVLRDSVLQRMLPAVGLKGEITAAR